MIEDIFARHLIINRNMLACYEVAHYGHRADVLAVDTNHEIIFEYEFKRSSTDLKTAEFKKVKYHEQVMKYPGHMKLWYKEENGRKKCKHGYNVRKLLPVPHYFYFVVPVELYEKEKDFLRSLKCGVITWREVGKNGHMDGYDFYVEKRTVARKSNLQKYPIALKNIAKRLKNIYAY